MGLSSGTEPGALRQPHEASNGPPTCGLSPCRAVAVRAAPLVAATPVSTHGSGHRGAFVAGLLRAALRPAHAGSLAPVPERRSGNPLPRPCPRRGLLCPPRGKQPLGVCGHGTGAGGGRGFRGSPAQLPGRKAEGVGVKGPPDSCRRRSQNYFKSGTCFGTCLGNPRPGSPHPDAVAFSRDWFALPGDSLCCFSFSQWCHRVCVILQLAVPSVLRLTAVWCHHVTLFEPCTLLAGISVISTMSVLAILGIGLDSPLCPPHCVRQVPLGLSFPTCSGPRAGRGDVW